MATTLTYNIELEEGSDISKVFLYKDSSTGLPKDNTGCVVEMQIKFEYLPAPAVYRSDVSSYILLGGSDGTISVNIPWLSIFNDDLGKGTYNLYITTPQGIKTMHSKGFLTVVRSSYPVVVPGSEPSNDVNSSANVFKGPHETDSSLSVVFATNHPTINVSSTGGLGTLALLPPGSVNGTPLGVLPSKAVGARIYLSGPDSVTFTIAGAAPVSAPDCTFTLTPTTTGPNWDENLSSGQMIYITEALGNPKFRWI